jgi:predicted double-glycine peptidase
MVWTLAILMAPPTTAGSWVDEGSLRGHLPLRPWRSIRDEGIVKQRYDYSCGAAAMATLLRGQYGIEVTELDVLRHLATRRAATSFRELADYVADQWQLQAQGYALAFDALWRLDVAVIVYLRQGGRDHFSVLRGVDSQGRVWLADPAWGNRLFTAAQFRELWETRPDPAAPGKILVVLPGLSEGRRPLARQGYLVTESLDYHIRRTGCRICQTGLI